MAGDWCNRCQLPAGQCAHRQPVNLDDPDCWQQMYDLAAADDGHRIGPLIESHYYGRCPGCGEKQEPGEQIAYDEEQTAWICAGCAGL